MSNVKFRSAAKPSFATAAALPSNTSTSTTTTTTAAAAAIAGAPSSASSSRPSSASSRQSQSNGGGVPGSPAGVVKWPSSKPISATAAPFHPQQQAGNGNIAHAEISSSSPVSPPYSSPTSSSSSSHSPTRSTILDNSNQFSSSTAPSSAAASNQLQQLQQQQHRPYQPQSKSGGAAAAGSRNLAVSMSTTSPAGPGALGSPGDSSWKAVGSPGDSSWKAVGSPPRRASNLASTKLPPPLLNGGTGSGEGLGSPLMIGGVEEHDIALRSAASRQRAIRTRAASTPNPLFHDVDELDELEDRVQFDTTITTNTSNNIHHMNGGGLGVGGSSSAKWSTNLGMQWGPSPSIWNDSPTLISPGSIRPPSSAGVGGGGAGDSNRQHRSFSFSLTPIETGYNDRGIDIELLRNGENPGDVDLLASPDSGNFNQYAVPKARSRSKSSSAIFGLMTHHEIGGPSLSSAGYSNNNSLTPENLPPRPTSSNQDKYHNNNNYNNIWGTANTNANSPNNNINDNTRDLSQERDPALLHRRASTQPSSFPGVWDSIRTPTDLDDGMASLNIPSHEDIERFRQQQQQQQRRYSHAPGNLYGDYTQQQHQMQYPGNGLQQQDDYSNLQRRHTLSAPMYSGNSGGGGRYHQHLADTFDGMQINEVNETPNYEDINDYFENTEHRTRAWVEAGKNLQMQTSTTYSWPLYVVEFKAGRHDFFFVSDPSIVVKKGDLAIVEADRGKDLGKVIHDSIQNAQQLQVYQATHVDVLVDSQYGKEVHPKRIYRLAESMEVSMLVSKSQDEAKAMALCQTKIRQKKLPMEIVDAEYQWDRKKLTLYFVADRRIDFRELVRDLFKIYKTRIWMCAVNPLQSKSPN